MGKKHISAVKGRVDNDLYVTLGLTAMLMFFVISGFVAYRNTSLLNENMRAIVQTHETIIALDTVLSLMKDTETGQRGYVLTGEDKYLTPYHAAMGEIEERLSRLKLLTLEDSEQARRIPLIEKHIKAKLDELQQTIDLRRAKGFEAARAVVLSDRGKQEMDAVRTQVTEMKRIERERRMERIDSMRDSYRTALLSGLLTGILGIILSIMVAFLARTASANRRRQEWLQTGQVGLSGALFGERRVEELSEMILSFLANYLNAQAGVIFVRDHNEFRRAAAYGVPEGNEMLLRFGREEGLLGQAVKEARHFVVSDVPEGYISFGSALGQAKPRHLLIVPAKVDGTVNAVIELGFIRPIDEATVELLNAVAESMGVAIRSANYRSNLQNLLEETQRQSEELQAQSEELRVSNEELEEQSRVLKESQSRLEQQQAELEQTNSQLEEQAQQLEAQKDDLARTSDMIQLKAEELEQASQYKSNFLANMSHELRTPLNSSLILAKLLADNPDGNLSAEQVKYALTIQSSGNDLLTLINDILDLSKIEAGHIEIRPEPVQLVQIKSTLASLFEPLAREKGLSFRVSVAPGSPESLFTDRQRVEQVLKNLLSNAFKFTEKGNVELSISGGVNDDVVFSVKDTGIGIAQEQQEAVFDAFRQADGTISRKYGGTGLGLSISRELARLLGGVIQLVSEPGKGSTFTLIIPATFDTARVVSGTLISTPYAAAFPATPAPTAEPFAPYPRVEDDRATLKHSSRLILVIEDDVNFARILYDLAHQQRFDCVIATSAEEAVLLARQYLPCAVLLDVGLPDNSGLSVLDRLKSDVRTRHIPVHVVSANDYSHTAYSMGAIGYMVKPVKREELQKAFEQFEERMHHKMRRVLIVEDDNVQREGVKKLLQSHDVETVGVGTAAECLERLKESTFDCMVLDLTLPDATGYSLLETLSKEDSYSFPPVIVYTGRDLPAEEEQRLRRYSRSIIIKGAKSPERLLDEVTLFLHQVVSELPPEQQRMLAKAKSRDAVLEGRNILIVEDDVRNVYAVTSILEPRGAHVHIARNGREGLDMLRKLEDDATRKIDLVLMDVMMPEMDGLTATREIRKHKEWRKLPVIMLTAKAMKDDQERCMDAGANDYMAKPLDVEKLLSLVRVWMPR